MSTPPPVPNAQPVPDMVELWSLRADTLVELPDTDEGTLVLATRWGEVLLPAATPVLCSALERMSYGPVALRNLVPAAGTEEAHREHALLDRTLEKLHNVTVRSLSADGSRPLLSVVPLASDAHFHPTRPQADSVLRLSSYAVVRSDTKDLFVESPLCKQRVVLHRFESASLLCALAHPATAAQLAARLGLPRNVVYAVLGHLEGAGVIVRGDVSRGDVAFAEDHDPALASWSPVDLMMHARSRLGRDDRLVGATGEQPRESAATVPAASAHEPIALPHPELDEILRKDPPLTVALEARRSVRSYGARPVTLAQLAEFLYRSARVRTMAAVGSEDPGSSRPYPSIGHSYALELYLLVSNCEDLAPGAYHYDPVGHALRPLDTEPALAGELVGQARETGGLCADPPVLVVMTARFHRVMGRFGGLAYSGLLKDVGVLQQTLYLVCTAMGLAPCALAIGDSDLAARALGLDWSTESSIGEFVLGTLPTEESGMPSNGTGWQERCRRVLELWSAHTRQHGDLRPTAH
ncbi:SagB family peptide dehydrogenase [Streptomyces sp. NBC_00441]|uniref:SagB/ThcOx family dehydrogenase n=1 Tax=Streptomyces sp. NBC_00441 TaxID=2975742 RepID=UPI002E2C7402|nr:SagB family peptide dehydrogenase [Streptomyces sp. NBC_00441]